ncbi:MAG: LPS export ABC transporter periplasmic protein LptC [Nitrospinales bacterium]
MRNKIRWFLLSSAILIVGCLIYFFVLNFKGAKSPVTVSLGETGVDISIENFNVTHEELGDIIWELKAKSAKVNSTTKVTHLTKVELVLHQKNDKQSFVFADSGFLNDKTKDFELNGHVRLISNTDLINTQIR